MKSIFIVWGKEIKLSQYLAEALGAEIKQVYYKKIWSYKIPAFFRYVLQSTETLMILFYERPRVVIVQNPPVFAPLVALFYCKIFGAKLAIDSHTAAFLDKKWISFHWLFRFVAKRATLNSCHNYKNLEILNNWGIKPAMVMQFFNPEYDLTKLTEPLENEKIEKILGQSDFPVVMVNRFAADDDYETVIAVARLIPEADFFITGDSGEARVGFNDLPANVILTGYLAHDEFLKLMRRSRVVLAFTLRPDTVLWSIRESMALNKPFVTTDSEVLRHYFGEVGVFTESDAGELREKILEAARREEEIKQKIKIFLEKDKLRLGQEIALYKRYLSI